MRVHSVPWKIVSDKDAKFTSKFWKEFFVGLGIELAFSTTYHPQTYGQTERVNKILEDMLRMYVIHQHRRWEEYIPLVELYGRCMCCVVHCVCACVVHCDETCRYGTI